MQFIVPKKYDGFSFVEIMISLLLLSCIMLSFTAMQVYALRTLRSAYYFHLAGVQVWQMAERLRALGEAEGLSSQVTTWNSQNLQLLPQGSGSVIGTGSNYTISIAWGGAKNPCHITRTGDSGCISKTIQL